MHWLARPALAVAGLVATAACSATRISGGPDPAEPPPGLDVVQPYPIDRGDEGTNTPGTYKGLWLRPVTTGPAVVSPVDGVVGVVCIGMSNANQECGDFITRRNDQYASEINPAVRVINCAVGGHAIEKWIDPAFDATLWDACISNRLAAAGVRLDQVRVIYHKAANQFTTAGGGAPLPTYPANGSDYQNFLDHLSQFAARVKTEFPAVQAVYTSSRSYGGFAGNQGRGEPLSYEEGHALNSWLRDNASVSGVWYGWGPYLWAPACDTGNTNKGGICYDRQDYVADGVHPAATGRAKVSALLHARLLQEGWYRR
jgi:hypothetical protein